MDKIEALKFIANNTHRASEWQEAEVCHLLLRVLGLDQEEFTRAYLVDLLQNAGEDVYCGEHCDAEPDETAHYRCEDGGTEPEWEPQPDDSADDFPAGSFG